MDEDGNPFGKQIAFFFTAVPGLTVQLVLSALSPAENYSEAPGCTGEAQVHVHKLSTQSVFDQCPKEFVLRQIVGGNVNARRWKNVQRRITTQVMSLE